MDYRAVTKWNPWADLMSLQDEMNKLFQSTIGSTPRVGLLATDYLPPLDVVRTKDEAVIRMEVPGMKKEDLEITMLNDRILVRGEKKREEVASTQTVHRNERFFGSFERVIDLPDPVDSEKTRASFKDGVLEIVAPFREEARPRQIAIDVS